MDKEIEEMLEKGLMSIAKVSVYKANQLYQKLQILHYTKKQEHPDIFTCYLRTHRKN